jgi:hypothetical protein
MPIKRGETIAYDASYETWGINPSGPGYAWRPVSKLYTNVYELDTLNHSGWYKQLGSGDVGGPFRLYKETYNVEAKTVDLGWFRGPVVFEGRAGGWSGYNAPIFPEYTSIPNLHSQGTHAIAQSIPTNPSAQLATFVGELHEGIPAIIGSSVFRDRVKHARKAGGEYLNVEFGWKPMMSDLRSFAHAVKHGNKIIEGYRKGSDKKIKRRYTYPTVKDSQVYEGAFAHSGSGAFAFGTIAQSRERASWFEGAFRYHVPVPDTTMGRLKTYESYANRILGTRLTPEVVWNISPWSWLADWRGNVGDILHNVSALSHDGLVMQYGYMMCYDFTEEITAATAQDPMFGSSRVTRSQVTRQRVPATPYGFGFDMTALTGRQTAILVALGLARS